MSRASPRLTLIGFGVAALLTAGAVSAATPYQIRVPMKGMPVVPANSVQPPVPSSPVVYNVDAVDFGDLVVGWGQTNALIKATNEGTASVAAEVPYLAADSSTDFKFNASCAPSLSPNAFCLGLASATPNNLGLQTGSVVFKVDGVTKSVPLSYYGFDLVVEPAAPVALDFGVVPVGSIATRTVTYFNRSVRPVNMGGLFQFQAGGAGVYRPTVLEPQVTSDAGCGRPIPVGTALADMYLYVVKLAPGASCSATLSYRPTAVGNLQERLRASFNVHGRARFVDLTGSGS